MAGWWDNLINYIVPQTTQPPATSTPPPATANQGIVQQWYQQYQESKVAPAQQTTMQATPTSTIQVPEQKEVEAPKKSEGLVSDITQLVGKTTSSTVGTLRTELSRIFTPVMSSAPVQSAIKAIQETAAPAQAPQQQTTLSQLSQDIYSGASKVAAVIQTGMNISDVGARRIERQLPGALAEVYNQTYQLGKGIFLGAPKATVETVGMIPGGLETLKQHPEMIPAFAAAGVISQVKGMQEGLTERPTQTIGELIGMAAIGEAGKFARVGEVKVPTVSSGEVPIYKGLYVEIGQTAHPILGYVPKAAEAAKVTEIPIGFHSDVVGAVKSVAETKPIIGMPKAELMPATLADVAPGYFPRTTLETSVLARQAVLEKFGFEPEAAARQISVGREIIGLVSEQKTAFQLTKPASVRVFGKEIQLPWETPAMVREVKALPPEGLAATIEYLKTEKFKLSNVPTVGELAALERVADVYRASYTEGYIPLPEIADLDTISKPVLERMGIDITKMTEVKGIRYEHPRELPENVGGQTILDLETGTYEIVLSRKGLPLTQMLETVSHEISHVAFESGMQAKVGGLFVEEPVAIRGSQMFSEEFSKYYATAKFSPQEGMDIRDIFTEGFAPYVVGKYTSKVPIEPTIKAQYRTDYPEINIRAQIEKVTGSFSAQPQMLENFKRVAGDIDVHTYGTKEQAYQLAKGLQAKLEEIGIETRISGTTVETRGTAKEWVHAVQFLARELPEGYGAEGFGLRYGLKVDQPSVEIEGLPFMRLGEQATRKITGSMEFRPKGLEKDWFAGHRVDPYETYKIIEGISKERKSIISGETAELEYHRLLKEAGDEGIYVTRAEHEAIHFVMEHPGLNLELGKLLGEREILPETLSAEIKQFISSGRAAEELSISKAVLEEAKRPGMRLQPAEHRFAKDVQDAFTTASTLIESKAVRLGIPIVKQLEVARGRALLEEWKEFYPEIDWSAIGKEPIKVELSIEGIGKASKKSTLKEVTDYAKRFADPSYDLQYVIRKAESPEYLPTEYTKETAYKKEAYAKETYTKEAPYTPPEAYPPEYNALSYDISKYAPEYPTGYAPEKEVPYTPTVPPYKVPSVPTYPQEYIPEYPPKYPPEYPPEYPPQYPPEYPPQYPPQYPPDYPLTYPPEIPPEQSPKIPPLPYGDEMIGKRKRKVRRTSKAYQVRNPFTDLEDVLGRVNEEIRKETSTVKKNKKRKHK